MPENPSEPKEIQRSSRSLLGKSLLVDVSRTLDSILGVLSPSCSYYWLQVAQQGTISFLSQMGREKRKLEFCYNSAWPYLSWRMGKWTEVPLCPGLSPIIKGLRNQKISSNILKNLTSPIAAIHGVAMSWTRRSNWTELNWSLSCNFPYSFRLFWSN